MNIQEILFGSLANQSKLSRQSEKSKKLNREDFSKVLKKDLGRRDSFSTREFSLEELEVILGKVHVLGEVLILEPSFANVKKYKEKIKEFLKCVISQAVDLKTEKGHIRTDFRRSKYTIVHVVNQKLEKLASSVLQNQVQQLKLLESIGEIQGLLIDLIR